MREYLDSKSQKKVVLLEKIFYAENHTSTQEELLNDLNITYPTLFAFILYPLFIFLLGPAIVLLSSYALYLVFKTMRARKQLVDSNEKFSQ
ncbi:hypothetical protein E1Z16_04125 [Listeria monocytogenes]|uniref:Uncharacterized protein n=1 Tax=Listeria monocytogenes TaxID=1639 RepID=A0A4B0GLT5_LISMN|nr:hypothetical protein [Listeria monocytogenes]EAC2210804.1 hypothetical protein [Listeria monocytogenes]EAC2321884.1 hypothetical protein [Listeria monocytogenes]EAC2445513.1 hypothetical protein [Listeria monocytogenes]EAC2888500.1 hypothetical protein [Listeria monocytogenes]EAC2961744.1 hypothetical protein [Listeria monocytogenes]